MSEPLAVAAAERRDPSPSAHRDAAAGAYPADLSRLSLVELHVWHSRIRRQLDQDLLDPAGPHPITRDRHQELAAELDARGERPAPPGVVP